MNLTFPEKTYGAPLALKVFEANLPILLKATDLNGTTTRLALDAFTKLEDAEFTMKERVCKFGVYAASYGVTLTCTAGLGLTIYANAPALKAAVLSNVSSKGFGTFIPLLALDYICNKLTGHTPISSAIGFAARSVVTIPIQACQKFNEITTASFAAEEKLKARQRKELLSLIFDQNLRVYNNIANGLINGFDKKIDSPFYVYKLKDEVDQVQAKYPVIRSGLSRLKLSSLVIDQILDKLSRTIKTIKQVQLTFRNPKSEDDHNYNAELFFTIPEAELAGQALTKTAQEYFRLAKANQLGITYKVKSYASAALSGVGVGLGIELMSVALSSTPLYCSKKGMRAVITCFQGNNTTEPCLLALAVSSLAIPIATCLGTRFSKRVYSSCKNEIGASEEKNKRYNQNAVNELHIFYSGIARKFKQAYVNSSAKNKIIFQNKLPQYVKKLLVMEAELKKSNSLDIKSILQDLTGILEKISEDKKG